VSTLRIVVLSGADFRALAHLLRQIHREVRGVEICGVLYQASRPPKRVRRRLGNLLRNLSDPEYRSYIIVRALHAIARQVARVGHGLLWVAHACPRVPDEANRDTREELSSVCESIGCPLHLTTDVHSAETIRFVTDLRADLGVVWGTRLLKPELFNLPRLGSINIHRKKLPEYRGSGPTGMWELLDREREVGITIHRVETALDAGPIVDSTAVPITAFDTLATLDRKVHVAGNDLLVRVLSRSASGILGSTPQSGDAREFRKPAPHRLRQYTKQIVAERPPRRPERVYSLPTLLLRTLRCAPYVVARNWLRRFRGSFPIVILRYGGITDGAFEGIPLDMLLRHLAFLRTHYRIVSLDEAVTLLREGAVTTPTVVLTFEGESRDSVIDLRAAVGDREHAAALFVSPHHLIDGDRTGDAIGVERAEQRVTWSHLVHLMQQGVDIGIRSSAHDDPTGPANGFVAILVTSDMGFERCVITDDGAPNWAPPDGNVRQLSRCRQVHNLWELELVLQDCLAV